MGHLRLTTAGESHGPAEVCILTGIPAGLLISSEQVEADLSRRQQGYGRGGRMAIESDRARFLAGVRLGCTLGTPICISVENKDHGNWLRVMSPEGHGQDGGPPITVPRPGHADLSGLAKYGFTDVRDVLERASARETVARVASGAICKALLRQVGATIRGRVVSLGSVSTALADFARPESIDWDSVERSPVACHDAEASERMCEEIDRAREKGESLGGVFEVWCWGVCPGVGGYASIDDRLDGRLMGALGSIPAIKGVEIGEAFANARLSGSLVHDPMRTESGDTGDYVVRTGNRSAGLEGGMTNGMPLVIRAAMKPIPTLTASLPSVDLATMTDVRAHVERSDICAVPAARVVGEAMAALILASAYLEKFGGDSVEDFAASVRAYEEGLEARGLWRRSYS
ncbi:MAG TPA: chorismate synthase [Thermoleophilia bacterium]|nr:chorismate synthase [Thermoleophilia bacterium]